MIKFEPPKEEHNYIGIMFTHGAVNRYRENYPQSELRCVVVDEKPRVRLVEMLNHLDETIIPAVKLAESCLTRVANANSIEEVFIAKFMGVNASKSLGLVICPDCLNKVVLMFEEITQTYKDLQSAAKEHAV